MTDFADKKPEIVEGPDRLSVNLPPSPSERLHPLIGLPISSIYNQEKLDSFRAQFKGPLLATFADLRAVKMTNFCGLSGEVDTLVARLPEALRAGYGFSPLLANAPGFDEVFLLSQHLSQGEAGARSSLEQYGEFEAAWNSLLKEVLPLRDPRVRYAEAGACISEEITRLQNECVQLCENEQVQFGVGRYLRFLEEKLGCEAVKTDDPDGELLLVGDLASRLACRNTASEVERILDGRLGESERRAMTFVAGHVKHEGGLDPVEAFRLLSFCEKLSSEHKKGVGDPSEVRDSSQWEERRKTAEARIQTMIDLESQFREEREKLYALGVPGSELVATARRLLHLVSSDRELGKGVVRLEQARNLGVEFFVDFKFKEPSDLTAIALDLKGGGAFSKRLGYAALGSLMQQVFAAAREESGAHFIIRDGGGRLILLTDRPAHKVDASRLLSRIEDAVFGMAGDPENRERLALAAVDDIQRVAVFDVISKLQGKVKETTPYAFLSASVDILPVEAEPGVLVGELVEALD